LTINAVACALFVPTGLITVMLGPLLPTLSARWSLNDTHSGYLLTAQFVGSLLGTVLSGFVLLRIAFRWTMILGVLFMALGAALLAAGGYWCGLAAVFTYGIGIGLTVPTANLLVAQAAGKKRSSVLNLLNFFWGAGAVACPFLVTALRRGEQLSLFIAALLGFLGLLILALLTVTIGETVSAPQSTVPGAVSFRYLANVHTLAYGAMFFLYVGSETALGAWLATFAKRATITQGEAWATAPAYFYGALLAGRVAGSWTLRHISDLTEARLSALLAVGGVAALLYMRTLGGIAITAAVVGLGLSTLYPTAIGLAAATLGSAASRVMGTLFALSTLGGATIPWLVGYVSTRFGSLRGALLVPLIGCALIATLYWNPALVKHRTAQSTVASLQ
jgi:fucose permease